MLAAHGGVAQLLSAEVIPVDAGIFQIQPGRRIVGHVTLNIVILEQHDIGQVAEVSGRTGGGHTVFHVRGTGYQHELQLEIGIHVCLVVFRGGTQGIAVEVVVPVVHSQLLRQCGRGAQHHAQRKYEGYDFLGHRVSSSFYLFPQSFSGLLKSK